MAEISPSTAAALYAQQAAPDIIARTTEVSTALQVCRTQPMGTKTARMAVIDSVPTAGWVKPGPGGSPGRKPVSDMAWAGATLTAEEIAVIVVIPEDVMDDTLGNVQQEVINRCAEAIAVGLDDTIYFGTGSSKPASFPDGLVVQSLAAGHTADPNGDGIAFADSLNEVFSLVEDADGTVTFVAAQRRVRGLLRGLRGPNGDLIYAPGSGLAGAGTYDSIFGVRAVYPPARAWDGSTALALVGDGNYAIIGVRQDITTDVFDQGVVQDGTGAIVRNLMQDDSIAIRVKARFAFATTSVPAGGFPFAVLEPVTAGTLAVSAQPTNAGADTEEPAAGAADAPAAVTPPPADQPAAPQV